MARAIGPTRWTEEAAPGHPYWWEGAGPGPDLPADPPAKTDILIIGAGYTGLSAAIAAHDAGARVTVVEAGVPGRGASTRNGGMFGAHPRLGWDALAKTYGAETADGVFAEAAPAMTAVRDLIAREKIDCDLQEVGRVQLAWTPGHFENQKAVAKVLQSRTSVTARIVEHADLGAEIGTDQYYGGLLLPEHCGLHPRKLHDGLLAAVLKRGITVVANCPVTGWQRSVAGFTVETPRGTIRAERLILATNGYTPRPFLWHRRRVFPLPSFLIATEQLDPALIAEIAPGRRMMVETRARFSYFRLSPDGTRILWGGRAAMRPVNLITAAARLRATMCQVWPQLADVRLSHVWTGFTGYTFGHMPAVGEDRGLHFAMGYSGSGTVMAPYLGTKVGLRAAGAAGGETAYANTVLRPSWLNPLGTPHFLYAADLWYRHRVDPAEGRAARRG